MVAELNTENVQIIETAKHYVKAFKDKQADTIVENFQQSAFKMGYFYDFEKGDWMEMTTHSYDQIKDWSKTYNIDNVMPNSDIHATLLSKQSKTAVVQIIAEWAPNHWGNDYIMLSKHNNRWVISCVFWQSII